MHTLICTYRGTINANIRRGNKRMRPLDKYVQNFDDNVRKLKNGQWKFNDVGCLGKNLKHYLRPELHVYSCKPYRIEIRHGKYSFEIMPSVGYVYVIIWRLPRQHTHPNLRFDKFSDALNFIHSVAEVFGLAQRSVPRNWGHDAK